MGASKSRSRSAVSRTTNENEVADTVSTAISQPNVAPSATAQPAAPTQTLLHETPTPTPVTAAPVVDTRPKRALLARVRSSANGAVTVKLWTVPQGERAPVAYADLEELEAKNSDIAEGALSTFEVHVRGLRVVHRQRLGRGLVFLGLRGANTRLIEAVLRDGVFTLPASSQSSDPSSAAAAVETTRLSAACALGDVVKVTGLAERSKGRISVLVRKLETEEAWADLFGLKAIFRDDVLHGAGMPKSLWHGRPRDAQTPVLLLQVVASHAARLTEYMGGAHGVPALATVAPISGFKLPRDERCLLIRAPHPAQLVATVLADKTVARFVQRWYVVDTLTISLEAAADALTASLHRTASAGGATTGLAMRVQAFPRSMEARLVEMMRERGFLPDPRASLVACAAYIYGAIVVGVLDGTGAYAAALGATSHDSVMKQQRPGRSANGQLDQMRRQQPSSSGEGMAANANATPGWEMLPNPSASLSAASYQQPEKREGGVARGPPSGKSHENSTTHPRNGGNHETAEDDDASTDSNPAQVSRAFYKLQEVATRFGVRLDVAHAIDCGASPGGWTTCLVQSGCARVTAVDPGGLYLPPAVMASGRVEHMQCRIEEALPELQARGNVRFDLLVCDMNLPPSTVVGVAIYALPLLTAGAALVLTFKNSFPRKSDWTVALEAGLAELRGFADRVEVLHLLANTSKETTVVGYVRKDIVDGFRESAPRPVPSALHSAAAASVGGGSRARLEAELRSSEHSAAATIALASGRAASAAEAAEASRMMSAVRARCATHAATTLMSKPRSRAERGAMTQIHAQTALAWERVRALRGLGS